MMSEDLNRREFAKLALALGACAAGLEGWGIAQESSWQGFSHPGLLHSSEDLRRWRRAVEQKEEPIYSGYLLFREHPQSKPDYVIRGAVAEVGRNPTIHVAEFDSDANAAYQCAVLWTITGEEVYAAISYKILQVWSSTLQKVTGADAVLCASLGGFKYVNAAELLRSTYGKWIEQDTKVCERVFLEVLFPVLENFASFANGNWDTAAIKTMMAIGVFCNRPDIFQRAVLYYLYGCGDGRLTHYIYQNGQCQESGRDQQHTQLGLAHLGDCCEIAWHQGLDLYAVENNLLLRGFEYTAAYNLGESVPFTPDHDRTGKYYHPAISERGKLRPVYEQIYNHYVYRAGKSAPFTKKAVESLRPEGAAQGADHPGFGTLLFARTGKEQRDAMVPGLVSGLVARGESSGIRLRWAPLRVTAQYTVERAEQEQGPYRTVARNLRWTEWTDTKVKAGSLAFYRVQNSSPVASVAGLPAPWSSMRLGSWSGPCNAWCDGKSFRLESGGESIFTGEGQFLFVEQKPETDFTLTARLLPLLASQLLHTGLLLRQGEGAEAVLALLPDKGSDPEHPHWTVVLSTRKSSGEEHKWIGQYVLPSPLISYGRVMLPLWFRLERSKGHIAGAFSADGESWHKIAETPGEFLQGNLSAGLFLTSGLGSLSTEVVFDSVRF